VDLFLSQLLSNHRQEPVNIHLATKAAALDIITSYCFSHSFDTLKAPKFEHPILLGMDSATAFGRRYRHLAVLRDILSKMPQRMARMIGLDSTAIVVQLRQLGGLVTEVMENPQLDGKENQTIVHALYGKKDAVPAPPDTTTWLLHEALNLRFAGSDTVSGTVAIGICYILQNPRVHTRLVEELVSAWPDKDSDMKWEDLEKIPYLV
jgi:hypothetical protein